MHDSFSFLSPQQRCTRMSALTARSTCQRIEPVVAPLGSGHAQRAPPLILAATSANGSVSVSMNYIGTYELFLL